HPWCVDRVPGPPANAAGVRRRRFDDALPRAGDGPGSRVARVGEPPGTLANRTPPKLKVIDFGAARNETPPKLAVVDEHSATQVVRIEDDLVSLRSNELRAPLARMVEFAELIESGDLTEEQRRLYAASLLREGRRLNALVNNALALQRLETGNRAMDLAPVDVHALIARAVLAAGEDEKRPIRTHLPKPLPLVSADAEAILEVLANFLSNARRFSPDGGVIEIGAREDG